MVEKSRKEYFRGFLILNTASSQRMTQDMCVSFSSGLVHRVVKESVMSCWISSPVMSQVLNGAIKHIVDVVRCRMQCEELTLQWFPLQPEQLVNPEIGLGVCTRLRKTLPNNIISG